MKIKIDVDKDKELLCMLYACKLYFEKHDFEAFNVSISSDMPFKDWVSEFSRLVLYDYCISKVNKIKEMRKEFDSCRDV